MLVATARGRASIRSESTPLLLSMKASLDVGHSERFGALVGSASLEYADPVLSDSTNDICFDVGLGTLTGQLPKKFDMENWSHPVLLFQMLI